MPYILSDNTEIYFLLERSNRLFSDFSRSHIELIEEGDDLYLVLYDPAKRDFTAFVAKSHLQNKNELPGLLQLLREFDGYNCPHQTLQDAIRLMEDRMLSGDSSGFFFDAH